MSAPTLAQKVANIQYMPVLMAATKASKDPTEGFLVKDIVKMSFDSPQSRLFLQKYLVNQLITSNNVYVKTKVLKLFQILLDEGHIEFKQNLRRQPEPFNEASKLRPHQPKDQQLVSECGRIRDMANKVLDMLYAETPELRRPEHVAPIFEDQLTSEGSEGSGSRITGFGNTPSVKPASSTTDKLKSLFGTSTKQPKPVTYDRIYATMDPVPHNANSSSPYTPQIQHGYSPAKYTEGSMPSGAPHSTGRAGGGWDDGRDIQPGYKHTSSTPSSLQTTPSQLYEQQQQQQQEEEEGRDLSDLEQERTKQERKLVEDITAPGGVRAAPPRESLNNFISRCKVLDCLAVVEYLREKLHSEETQVVLRTLFVIEALLRSDVPDILSQLDLTLEEMSELSSSSHNSIKAKASKILMQLKVAAETVQVASSASQRPTGTGDILSLGNGEVASQQQHSEDSTIVTQESDDLASLFSGMAVSGEKVPRPWRPVQSVQPVRKPLKQQQNTTEVLVQPSVTESGSKEVTSFDDILGLGDPHEVATTSSTLVQEEPLIPEEDDSLLVFEEEEEFDPLKRSNSMNRSGSFGSKRTGSIGNKPLALLINTSSQQKLVSEEQSGLLGALSGIDLSSTQQQPLQQEQTQTANILANVLQPVQTSTTHMNVGPPNLNTPYSQPIQMGGQMPVGVAYAPTYGMGSTGGVMPRPMMYAQPGMVYMGQPGGMMLGGEARPVQRAASKDEIPPTESSFCFLGKSSKSNAFDFVQEEMKASQAKK